MRPYQSSDLTPERAQVALLARLHGEIQHRRETGWRLPDASEAVVPGDELVTLAGKLHLLASPELRAAYDNGRLSFDVGAAAGFDLTVRWDPAFGDLVEWTAPAAFQGAERRAPGEVRLAWRSVGRASPGRVAADALVERLVQRAEALAR